MAITIKDILNKNLFHGITLAAGNEGISAPITSVNVMEILGTPDSLKKGELLITTAYDLDNFDKYQNIIMRLKSRGVAGMIIQVGYYIEKIPDYIISAADELNFPILNIPSHYPISTVLHTIIHEIDKAAAVSKRSFINYEYFFPSIKNQLLGSDQLDFDHYTPSYLFCITTADHSKAQDRNVASALAQIQSYLNSCAKSIVYETYKNSQAVFCLSFRDKYNIQSVAYDLHIQLTFISEQEGIDFFVGIDSITSIEHLHLAFDHTIKSIALLNDISAKRGVCSYEHYIFIKMFGQLYRDNRSFVLENQALQVLLTKDRNSNTNYVHTIRTYLSENCNITHTAERLFIHRHTLMNRIQAITELCGINFDDYYTRIYLSMALFIHDYFAV